MELPEMVTKAEKKIASFKSERLRAMMSC